MLRALVVIQELLQVIFCYFTLCFVFFFFSRTLWCFACGKSLLIDHIYYLDCFCFSLLICTFFWFLSKQLLVSRFAKKEYSVCLLYLNIVGRCSLLQSLGCRFESCYHLKKKNHYFSLQCGRQWYYTIQRFKTWSLLRILLLIPSPPLSHGFQVPTPSTPHPSKHPTHCPPPPPPLVAPSSSNEKLISQILTTKTHPLMGKTHFPSSNPPFHPLLQNKKKKSFNLVKENNFQCLSDHNCKLMCTYLNKEY